MNLINAEGNVYAEVNGVSVEKNTYTSGYNLIIRLRGDEEPVCIAYSTPEEGILLQVCDHIANKLVHDEKVVDLRESYVYNNKYIGPCGCTLLPNEASATKAG